MKAKSMGKAGTAKAQERQASAAPAGEAVEAETFPDEAPDEGGRPTKFKPEMVRQAGALAGRGMTDFEIAEFFGVSDRTFYRWLAKHQDLAEAVSSAKEVPDQRVARALYSRAVGYSYNSEKIFSHQGSITRAQCVEHVPPDVAAAKMWLTNRDPEQWRDKTEVDAKGSILLEVMTGVPRAGERTGE